MPGIKGRIARIPQLVKEAIAEPLYEEAKSDANLAAEALSGAGSMATKNPQEVAKQQQEQAQQKQKEAAQVQNIRLYLSQYQRFESEHNQHKILKNQEEEKKSREDDEKRKVKQFEMQKRQENISVFQKQRKTEQTKRAG